jgi:hypothetical protein
VTKVVRFCLLLEKGTKISATKMRISIYPNIHSINSSTQDLLFNRSNKFWLISYLLIFRQLPSRFLRKMYKINKNKLYLLHNTTPKFWHFYSCPKFNYSCRKVLKLLIYWSSRFSKTRPRKISAELCKNWCNNYSSQNLSKYKFSHRSVLVLAHHKFYLKVSCILTTFIQVKYHYFHRNN